MYEAIAQFVQQQLQTNQFFFWWVGAHGCWWCVGLLSKHTQPDLALGTWSFLIEVDILDRESAFDWLDQWLAQHRYTKNRARYLSIRTRARWNTKNAKPIRLAIIVRAYYLRCAGSAHVLLQRSLGHSQSRTT